MDKDIVHYMDDIILFSDSYEQQLATLQLVLTSLRKAGLKCQTTKNALFRQSLIYLGHNVSQDGVGPEPRKLDALREWPLPKSGTGMLS